MGLSAHDGFVIVAENIEMINGEAFRASSNRCYLHEKKLTRFTLLGLLIDLQRGRDKAPFDIYVRYS